MKKVNEKGFTMAELLIVVAIIAIMVAIAIPTFGTQLERAREGVDLSNVRNAYAEAAIHFSTDMANNPTGSVTYSDVAFKQLVSGWTIDTTQFPCDGINTVFDGDLKLPGDVALTFTKDTDAQGNVTITLDSAALRLKAADVGEGDDAEPNSKDNPFKITTTGYLTAKIKDAVKLDNNGTGADEYTIKDNSYTETTIGGNIKLTTAGGFDKVKSEDEVTAMDNPVEITVQLKATSSKDSDGKSLACKVWVQVTE